MRNINELDFHVVKEIKEQEFWQPDMKILYVIEGTVDVGMYENTYRLGKADIILIDSYIAHKITIFPNTVIGYASYPYRLVMQMLQSESWIFQCNSVADTAHSYNDIRKVFKELIYQYFQKGHRSDCLKQSLLYKLLDILLNNYICDDFILGSDIKDSERMRVISQYINNHYFENVSLSEIAHMLFISNSVASRYFRKMTGMGFVDYVNQVRIRYALRDILYTDKNITNISMDCGFSNPSVFNKVFRSIYQITPTEYRKKHQKDIHEWENESIRQKEEFCARLQVHIEEEHKNESDRKLHHVEVCVDTRGGENFENRWNKIINVGAVSNLALANLQFHVLYLMEHLGFKYARIWNIFSKKLMISDGIRRHGFNYNQLDVALDFLVKNHISPYIDLGKRPSTAIKTEGETVFFEDEYIHFESRHAWEAVVNDFIGHIINRYGKEEIDNWIFEVSRDIIHEKDSPCYVDKDYDYYHVYYYVYRSLREHGLDSLVGASDGMIVWGKRLLSKFLERCREGRHTPAFIACTIFPYDVYQDGEKRTYRRSNRENIELEQVQKVRETMDESGFKSCPLYIIEMNSSLSSRNYLNDSCFRAAYLAKKIPILCHHADVVSVWMGSDWVSCYSDTYKIANGGNGLVTKDTICKPAFHALQLMNQLGDVLIEKGENYIITKKGGSSFYILCFNYKRYGSNYYRRSENIQNPEELRELFEDSEDKELTITLKYLEKDKKYTIKRRRINPAEGSIFAEWKQFGYETELSGDEVKYIRDACFPRISAEKQTAVNGELKLCFELKAHEVSMFHIYGK